METFTEEQLETMMQEISDRLVDLTDEQIIAMHKAMTEKD